MIDHVIEVSGVVEPMRFVTNGALVEEVGSAMVGSVHGPDTTYWQVKEQELVEKGFIGFLCGADAVG